MPSGIEVKLNAYTTYKSQVKQLSDERFPLKLQSWKELSTTIYHTMIILKVLRCLLKIILIEKKNDISSKHR